MATNGRVIADAALVSLNLQSVLGGYELVFALKVSVNGSDRSGCGVSIVGAEIKVGVEGGRSERCGFARPGGVFELRQRKFATSSSVCLVLPMHSGQVAALEALRGTGDLDFELVLSGRLAEGEDVYNVSGGEGVRRGNEVMTRDSASALRAVVGGDRGTKIEHSSDDKGYCAVVTHAMYSSNNASIVVYYLRWPLVVG